jgi:succinyl-CoA synthetase alpha subunit
MGRSRECVKSGMFKKPMASFIAGRLAPAERKLGHADAIIKSGRGTVRDLGAVDDRNDEGSKAA